MRTSDRFKMGRFCGFQWLLLVVLLAGGPALAGTTYMDNGVVSNSFSQTSPAGTNYFLGNVGIGTNAPSCKLHVAGGLQVDGAMQVAKQGDISMGEYTNGIPPGGTTASTCPYCRAGSWTNALQYWNGSTWTSSQAVLSWEPADRTVNINTGMTFAAAQAAINGIGRYIPAGVTVILQFGDGTYTWTNSSLVVQGFHGGGSLWIQGNTNEANATTLHTTQSVVLDRSGASDQGITVQNCSLGSIDIRNLKISFNSTGGYNGVWATYNSSFTQVRFCYLLGNGTSSGRAIRINSCGPARVQQNYVSNCSRGIEGSDAAIIYSRGSDDTGTAPVYGLSSYGSIIFKYTTQPSGSTADELKSEGGQIF